MSQALKFCRVLIFRRLTDAEDHGLEKSSGTASELAVVSWRFSDGSCS